MSIEFSSICRITRTTRISKRSDCGEESQDWENSRLAHHINTTNLWEQPLSQIIELYHFDSSSFSWMQSVSHNREN